MCTMECHLKYQCESGLHPNSIFYSRFHRIKTTFYRFSLETMTTSFAHLLLATQWSIILFKAVTRMKLFLFEWLEYQIVLVDFRFWCHCFWGAQFLVSKIFACIHSFNEFFKSHTNSYSTCFGAQKLVRCAFGSSF